MKMIQPIVLHVSRNRIHGQENSDERPTAQALEMAVSKIAVVGAGISGLTAAYLLSRQHDVTVFEANDYLGGHADSHEIIFDNVPYIVDTGFIVYNDRTYPNFVHLLEQLNCRGISTEMSFSMKKGDLEYNGHNVDTLFAQRRNLLRPGFLAMLKDIIRFNRVALSIADDDERSIAEYLADEKFGSRFGDDYLLPMASAIWSTGTDSIASFPIRSLVTFFDNHGLLSLGNRPQWKSVEAGSQRYVNAIAAQLHRYHLAAPVESITRSEQAVILKAHGERYLFDEVVIATHSDQALRMLTDPSKHEQKILGSILYEENEAVLHTDASLMPRSRKAWASWNYHIADNTTNKATLTYNMNILQQHQSPEHLLVTLNASDQIDPARVLKVRKYHHPVFNQSTQAAQKRHADISGPRRTHFCGAYWRYGFHEDGVISALRVCRKFGIDL